MDVIKNNRGFSLIEILAAFSVVMIAGLTTSLSCRNDAHPRTREANGRGASFGAIDTHFWRDACCREEVRGVLRDRQPSNFVEPVRRCRHLQPGHHFRRQI